MHTATGLPGGMLPLDACKVLLDGLNVALDRNVEYFDRPVDASVPGLEDYLDVIAFPMDLGTIREKLAAGKYRDPPAFKADCALAFDNCVKYNPKGTDAHVMGETMTQELEKKWVELGFC